MAYADQSMSSRKAISIGLVALLHAALGYAFITGLAYNVVQKVASDLKTFDVVEDAPPPEEVPPPPPPKQDVAPPPVVAPPPIVQIQAPVMAPPTINTAPPPPVITQAPPTAPPAPPKPMMAVGPKPKSAPGNWVTDEDYPSSDMRDGNEGVTGFRLEIGTDGKVTACNITSSSGFSSLDNKACQMLLRRGRFAAAKDTEGNPIVSAYSSRVKWQIPKN